MHKVKEMNPGVSYEDLSLAELKRLCLERGLERCSGKGVTRKVLAAALHADDDSRRATVSASAPSLEAPSLEELESRTLQELKKECVRLKLSGCSGKGVTKSILAQRIYEALQPQLPDAETESDAISTPTESRKSASPTDKKSASPTDKSVSTDKKSASPTDKKSASPGTKSALPTVKKSASPGSRKISSSPDRKRNVETLQTRLLSAETADIVRQICRNGLCDDIDWNDLFARRDPQLHRHIIDNFAVGNWRDVYENAVAFRARFRQLSDFGHATPAKMREYGVVWPAMVRAYRKMKEASVRIGDIDVLRDAGVTAEERRKLVTSAGTREAATWLMQGLDATKMHQEFLESVRTCNITVAMLLLETGVLYPIKAALEAALPCRELLSRLVRDNKTAVTQGADVWLSKLYLLGFVEQLADLVIELDEDALYHVLAPHLMLLAKHNEAKAVIRVLRSDQRSLSIRGAVVQDIFVAAVESGAVGVVEEMLKLLGDELSLRDLLAKAVSMDRREMAGLIYSYLPDNQLQEELQQALTAATSYRASMRNLVLEWIERSK